MSRSAQSPDKALLRLEWTVIRRLDGYLQGDYRTLFRGFGLDLADIREYQVNDDVRYMDWNVTARLGAPYVRQFNEDREITAWFLLDLSPSVDFGSAGMQKRQMLIDFVTVMARLLTRHGNRVGAIFYSDKMEKVIPARAGRNHVLYLLHTLQNHPLLSRSPLTNLSDLLSGAHKTIRSRSLVFIVSDFFSSPGWPGPLALLAQRHETLAIRIFDPLERELPDLGMVLMQDAESGEQLFVDTHSRGFRKRFAAAAAQHEAEVRSGLRAAGVDALELSTRDDIVDSILRFADLRKQRSLMVAGVNPPTRMGGHHDIPLA